MIFNLTNKNVSTKQLKKNIEDISVKGRLEVRRLLNQVIASLDREERMATAQAVVSILEDAYQDVYDTTPEVVVCRPKRVLLDPSCPYFDYLKEELIKEEWIIVELEPSN